MEQREFMLKCQKLNKQYKEIFNCLPDYSKYDISREEYLKILADCISEKKNIDSFIDADI